MESQITKNIMEYMNSMGQREFIYIEVSCISASIKTEYCDRKRQGIKINTKTKAGRIKLNERIAYIVNKKLGKLESVSIKPNDIRLYKRCFAEEYSNRTGKCSWGFKELRNRLGYDAKTGIDIDILREK